MWNHLASLAAMASKTNSNKVLQCKLYFYLILISFGTWQSLPTSLLCLIKNEPWQYQYALEAAYMNYSHIFKGLTQISCICRIWLWLYYNLETSNGKCTKWLIWIHNDWLMEFQSTALYDLLLWIYSYFITNLCPNGPIFSSTMFFWISDWLCACYFLYL